MGYSDRREPVGVWVTVIDRSLFAVLLWKSISFNIVAGFSVSLENLQVRSYVCQ